jgi:hypothetical protein
MELLWEIRDMPPQVITDLSKSEFDTASPLTLNFTEAERGKRVYYAPRWESKGNKKGPWGGLGSAIIP